MPDINIGVSVTGASQAAGALQQVGAAADSAGASAQTAGSRFAGMGGRIAGAMGGIGILIGGFFQLQDTFDNVAKADLSASRAHVKAGNATAERVKAEKELNDALSGGIGMQINSNGEVNNSADVKNRAGKATGSLQEKIDKYNRSVENETNALENEKQKTREADQAKQRLAFTIAGNIATMAGGIGTMIAFARGVGSTGTSAASAAEGMAKTGGALSGTLGTLVKVAAPLAAIAIGYFLLKNNIGGALSAVTGFEVAISKAVPALTPVLNLINGLGRMIGIGGNFQSGLALASFSFKQIQEALSPLGAKLAQASGAFQQFFAQLGKGDVSGAFHTLVASATALGSQIMGAIRSVNWAQVWQGLVNAFNSTISFLRTAAATIGSSISAAIKNWNWGDAWKSLQDAFWSSVRFLNNVSLTVTAAVKWILNNIWPTLVTIGQSLHAFWGAVNIAYDALVKWAFGYLFPTIAANVIPALHAIWGALTFAYGALVNWAFRYAFPAVRGAVDAALVAAWGAILFTYNALVNFAVKYVWPTLEQVKQSAPHYGDLAIQAGTATIHFAVFKVAIPQVDIQTSDLINAVSAAIRNAPGAVQAAANAIADWFHELNVKPQNIKVDVGAAAVSVLGGQASVDKFISGLKSFFPETIKAIDNLKLTIGSIDTSGMSTALQKAGKEAVTYFWNSFTTGLSNASKGVINLPKIPVDADTKPAEQKAQDFAKNKVPSYDPTMPFKIDNTAAIRQVDGIVRYVSAQRPTMYVNVVQTGGGGGGSTPVRSTAPISGATGVASGFGPAMVSKPTLFLVGEAGPEMMQVVPMKKGTSKSNREMLIHHDIIPMAHGTRGGMMITGSSSSMDIEDLASAVEKLASSMRSGGLEANLIVDGRRMASTSQKYIGDRGYGDR